EAIDRVIAGPAKKSRVVSEKERKIVAYHESGHTVIGMVLDDAETVHKVTIVPRGQAGGYAVMLPKEDRYMVTRSELFDRITGLRGGRVAEEIIFGKDHVSTGASNDFQRATQIARSMITEYGMSDKIGPTQFNGGGGNQVFLGRDINDENSFSDAIAHLIDTETQNFINHCYNQAVEILTENKDKLELVAEKLLEIETLDAEQIESLFETGELPPEKEIELSEESADFFKNNGEAEEDNASSDEEGPAEAKSYDEIKESVDEKERTIDDVLGEGEESSVSDHDDTEQDVDTSSSDEENQSKNE